MLAEKTSEQIRADVSDNAYQCLYMESKKRGESLTRRQINRAIVIDFEGKGKPRGGKAPDPQFIGVLMTSGYKGYFIDPQFKRRMIRPVARGMNVRLYCRSLEVVMEEVLQVAEGEDRVILHFSKHEVEVLYELLPDDLIDRMSRRLADGKPFMKKGATRLLGGKPEEIKLDYLSRILVPELAETQEDVHVPDAIRALERGVASGKFTEKQLVRLAKLLEYNRLDLELLQAGCRASKRIIRQSRHPWCSEPENEIAAGYPGLQG